MPSKNSAAKSKTSSLKVVMRNVADINPYPANAKMHPEVQVGNLMQSIRQFGFVNPILLDGDNIVIAGHGRLLAAAKLGMDKVPTIQLAHLAPDEARALRLADNSIPEGGIWNPDLLEAELASLRAVDFELEPLGLDSIQLPEEPEEPVPAAPKPQRNKTTIFISVKNEDVLKARKAISAALDKAKIGHNL